MRPSRRAVAASESRPWRHAHRSRRRLGAWGTLAASDGSDSPGEEDMHRTAADWQLLPSSSTTAPNGSLQFPPASSCLQLCTRWGRWGRDRIRFRDGATSAFAGGRSRAADMCFIFAGSRWDVHPAVLPSSAALLSGDAANNGEEPQGMAAGAVLPFVLRVMMTQSCCGLRGDVLHRS